MSLKYLAPLKRISYMNAERIQQAHARLMLDAKSSKTEGPGAALFAFEMEPVYTCGRRQVGNMTREEIEHYKDNGKAEFVETLRGGHVTFHGPGQVVMYPVVDLRALGIKVRDYVCKLEGGIIDVLEKYNLEGKRTHDTGVWLDDRRKIASIGIHVRRSITSHGIGLNVSTDHYWFDRIVACNLPEARVVDICDYTPDALVGQVADDLAQIYADKFGLELVPAKTIEDVPKVFGDESGLIKQAYNF